MNAGTAQPHSQVRFQLRTGCVSTSTSTGGAVLFIPSNGEYAMLNDVSALVVDALESAHSLDAVVDLVLAEYEAPRDVATADVERLLSELVRKGAIEEVHP